MYKSIHVHHYNYFDSETILRKCLYMYMYVRMYNHVQSLFLEYFTLLKVLLLFFVSLLQISIMMISLSLLMVYVMHLIMLMLVCYNYQYSCYYLFFYLFIFLLLL